MTFDYSSSDSSCSSNCSCSSGSSTYSESDENYNLIEGAKDIFRNSTYFFKSSLQLNSQFLEKFFSKTYKFDDDKYINYQVKNGDTLEYISKRFLGFEDYKHYIYLENRDVVGDSTKNLKEGIILKIPHKKNPLFIYRWWRHLMKKYVRIEYLNIVIKCETNGLIKNLFQEEEKSYGVGHFQEMVIQDILNHPIYKFMFKDKTVNDVKQIITNPNNINFVMYNICLILCQIDTCFYYLCKHDLFSINKAFKTVFISAFHNYPLYAVNYLKNTNKEKFKRNMKQMFKLKPRYKRTRRMCSKTHLISESRIQIYNNVKNNLIF